MSDLSQRALEIAVSQIGQQENPKGSNWGHPVQDYLLSVGINFPASWCMAFVYWCYEHAAKQLGMANPLKKTGGVLAQWANDQQIQTQLPQQSYVFIMDFGKGFGHTGFIETIDPDGKTLHTIEGNTNDTGAREGFEVCRRQRLIGNPLMKGYLMF